MYSGDTCDGAPAVWVGQLLGVSGCDEDDLYAAMDWVLARKDAIENALAARHLANGTLVLYDVSSAAFEGRTCPLGAIGHPRDGVKGRLQIVYGLLCSTAGVPVAIEVFEGNTADPKTLAAQISKLKNRFGLSRVVPGRRSGHAHQRAHPRRAAPGAAGLDQRAARPADQGPGRDRRAAAVAVRRAGPRRDHLPGVSRRAAGVLPQPRPGRRTRPQTRRAAGRHRKRTRPPSPRPPAASSRPLRGKDKIALRVGKVINHYKMAKHFTLDDHRRVVHLHPQHRSHRRRGRPRRHLRAAHQPARHDTLTDDEVVLRYKDLADVERFFRTLNSELDVRPIRHRLADRVRAHMFLRMLSYYISWHMKQALAPILFDDNDKPAAAAKRANPVAAAQRSDDALTKAARKRTADDTPVHSFTSLLADLATLCANQIQPADDMPAFTMTTTPTPLQRRAFELLDVSHRHGLRVVSTPHHQTTKPQLNTPTRQHNRGNFGLDIPVGTPVLVDPDGGCGYRFERACAIRRISNRLRPCVEEVLCTRSEIVGRVFGFSGEDLA